MTFGIGTTEVEQVLATQCLVRKKPLSMRVDLEGRLRAGQVTLAHDDDHGELGGFAVGHQDRHRSVHAGCVLHLHDRGDQRRSVGPG
mgnify:CR=1 FL=1